MKKFLLIMILIFISSFLPAQSQETMVLTGGVSIEQIPNGFYGTWRVVSTLTYSNAGIFKEKNTDIWNLSRRGDVINLTNPFSGASATVNVTEIKGNYITFEKTGNYDGKKLTDSVKLNLKNNTFNGFNELKLDTFSDVDGHVIKSEKAVYKISGEKISGTGIKN